MRSIFSSIFTGKYGRVTFLGLFLFLNAVFFKDFCRRHILQIISDDAGGFPLDKIVFSGMERSWMVKKPNLWERKVTMTFFVTMTLCSSFFPIHQISYSWLLFSLCKEARKAWLSSSMPFLFLIFNFFSTKVVSMQCGVHFHTDVYIHQQMHAHASDSSLMKSSRFM